MNDLLNIESWMAPEKEPEEDLLEGFYHRQLEKSISMQNASALYHTDQAHRKDPKSYSKLKALITDVLTELQQNYRMAQKQKGQVKDRAIPVTPEKNKGDGERGDCKQRSSNGSCARSAKYTVTTMTEIKEREKEISNSGRQVRQKNSLLRNWKSVTGHAQLLCFSCKKGRSLTDTTTCILRSAPLTKKKKQNGPGTTRPFVHLNQDVRSPSPKRQPQSDIKQKETPRRFPTCRKSMLRETSSVDGQQNPKIQSIGQPTT